MTNRSSFPPFLALLLVFSVFTTAQCAPPEKNQGPRCTHSVRIVSTLPHDTDAFTQGLFVHGGLMYESTGQYGSSTVRITDIETGSILKRRSISDALFGEGFARLGGAALQLTWKAETGLIHDLETLEPLGRFSYDGQGWGLASGPLGLVMSNGSDELIFLDTSTLKPVRTIQVRDGDKGVRQLNELEWYGKVILANIWLSDRVAAIDPETGSVLAWIDLAPLRQAISKSSGAANGIAYDAETGRLYMTGKNWNRLFQVDIDPPLER